ncbi:pyrroline-5-carboxylate reductase [Beutenbergia cavernae DSM 12333]|uniref:Pyrroline-5-carboxylate reductase n=1 Tax=Beutenbergia cavernae (strain ATCC BAA-8 / DSM 12333 / CCUG 43141 / JCM 11478 / NBRC 16432 / NCIMB 13614 / HKI 0122) TaxID=471853 RepID=C5C1A9_BEUC1|nr:pyrroline-5-carboxylate reductase [Beutenbergia cavernae]ACQ81519.1 pyrroline-5-carboxylate reductase [Beutenbergia cavernae DSM 12333]
MRIALLGAGTMGRAVLTSILATDGVGADDVVVTTSRDASAEAVASRFGVAAGTDNRAAATDADVVVLGVKPQGMAALLDEIGPAIGGETLVASLAVGLATTFYEARLPAGTPVVRVMPNTPATIGQGVSALSAGAAATDAHLALLERLLAGTGLVVRVPESQQSVVAAVSGSGPAYVFHLVDALAEAGTAGGLPRATALRLAAQTVAGAGALAVSSGEHPAILREQVSSPGGTTLAALAELDDRGVRAAYAAAVRAAVRRAGELAADLDPGPPR